MTLTNSNAVSVVLMLLRLYLGCMIFTHGFRKVFRGGRLAGTARWFESIGMRPGILNAYAAASTELSAGALLAVGLLTPFASAALIAVMLVAIASVHFKNGFMITNPGGGMEYCLTLAVVGLAQGTLGAGRFSLDRACGIFKSWSPTTNLLVTAIVGVGGAVLQLATMYRPPRTWPE